MTVRPWSCRRAALSARTILAIGALASAVVVATLAHAESTGPAIAADGPARARISGAQPLTWDPALAGDASSASVLAQVFEGLTAFDSESRVQPALADGWTVADDGRQITFHLREGISYSDGTRISAADVIGSWLRLIDPATPSPLASLLADVEGATDYQAGRATRDEVGLSADGQQLTVTFRRPATYFLAVTASPSLAVVPPAMRGRLALQPPSDIVVSGAYLPSVSGDQLIRLDANANYWAGPPPLAAIEIVTDLGGRSPVSAFQDGELDLTPVGSYDASWMKYDRALGPQLRRTDSFAVHYYGFDTTQPPFDDTRVRLAFAQAVDWSRLVRLGTEGEPAGSMIPPGIAGHDGIDYRPAHDPEMARRLLAEAGYPAGADFPPVVLTSFGYGYEVAVAAEIEAELGISVPVEIFSFEDFLRRTSGNDRPSFWTLTWIADYPQAHDFLGLLLETGSSSNVGRWSNAEFDAAIAAAAATVDPLEQAAHYAAAQEVIRREAPAVPVEYGESWALSRNGLLGAVESSVGFVRLAGLDWAPGTGR
jgi:oligopeptide transport system substrate-binding protein